RPACGWWGRKAAARRRPSLHRESASKQARDELVGAVEMGPAPAGPAAQGRGIDDHLGIHADLVRLPGRCIAGRGTKPGHGSELALEIRIALPDVTAET